MLSERMNEAFDHLIAAAIDDNGVLDRKTTVLAGLAAALALGCATCIERFLERAREAAITDAEVGAVQAVVMTVSAGRVRNQDITAGDSSTDTPRED